MRILHVVPTYVPAIRYGGPIYSVHGLCRDLAQSGHEVHVFTTNVDGPDDSPVPLGRPVDLDGVKVRYFPSRLLRRLYWSPMMARALACDIRDFDLIHLHSVFLWPTWVAARAARASGVPYVLSPRGMLVKALVQRKNRLLKSAWISFIERRNIQAAAAIHVTSEIEARDLKAFGFNVPGVVTIPNGVDEPRPVSGDVPSEDIQMLLEQDRLILFLGRINWKKGLDRLIDAMGQVPDGHLAIVGNDEEDLMPQLAKQVESLQIGGRVTFVSRSVGAADKEALYAAASIFVLPSLSENFGNVVLEAMIRGCPVIVSPDVGAAEIAVTSGAGLVFDGSSDDLAAKISGLLEDPARATRMGEAGSRAARASYTWAMIAARMAEVYEHVIGRSKANDV